MKEHDNVVMVIQKMMTYADQTMKKQMQAAQDTHSEERWEHHHGRLELEEEAWEAISHGLVKIRETHGVRVRS